MEIGSFVFRDEGAGCITGTYMHDGNPFILPESAKRDITIPTLHVFEGTYRTSWLELNRSQVDFELIISRRAAADHIYDLTWKKNGKDFFKGEGRLIDGLLTGWYRQLP